jgi:ABC-type xylose transport system substrate-binding protein
VLAVHAWLEGRRDIVDDVLRESYSKTHGGPVIGHDRLTLGGSRKYYVSFNNVQVGKFNNVQVGKPIGDAFVNCATA